MTSSNDKKKLTDIMMGEAVLTLLHDGGPISTGSLITRLHVLAASEQNEIRKQACEWAINQVRESMAVNRDRDNHEAGDNENVHYLFHHNDAADDNDKH